MNLNEYIDDNQEHKQNTRDINEDSSNVSQHLMNATDLQSQDISKLDLDGRSQTMLQGQVESTPALMGNNGQMGMDGMLQRPYT